MPAWDRRDWAIVLALTILAGVLRFYQLGSIPPGLQFDEAFNALDAARVLEGARPLFLPDNSGREVLYTYLQAALASFLGLNVYTLRLTSALAGILTIPAAYILLRCLLTQDSRRVAAFTSLAVAISFWHLHFSHYGIRVILMPLLFSGVCGLFWLGRQRRSGALFLASGVVLGLSVWTHPTGRLMPLVLVGYAAWELATRRARAWIVLSGLAVTALTAFLVFLPLGWHFYQHPELFTGHASAVSIFAARVGGDAPLARLLDNLWRVAAMFSCAGDQAWIHNLAGRPVFDPLLSIPFWAGVFLWLKRLLRPDDPDRGALGLLALWSLVMLAPSVLSDAAPNFSRTLPALPALFVAVGLGLTWLLAAGPALAHRLRWATATGARVGSAVVAAILLISSASSLYDYFYRFPQREETYYAYDVDKLDAWAELLPLAADRQVYLSQLWAEHGTLRFLRRRKGIKAVSLDNPIDTIVLPVDEGAVYAFPPEDSDQAERLAAYWSGRAIRRTVYDRYGRPLLALVILDADVARDWPRALQPTQATAARFQGAPTLLGLRVDDAGEVFLFWRADEPISRSLTAFVQLLDADGRVVGQADRLPGNGSYPTSAWSPGDRVIERYRPTVHPCIGGGSVRVMVGWYDLAANAARVPRADAPGDTALAGVVTWPARSYPLAEITPPSLMNHPLTAHLALAGYARQDAELQAGAPLTVDLYWRGDPAAADEPVRIHLEAADQASRYTLWEGSAAPSSGDWRPQEILCRRLALRLPTDAAPGTYHLTVTANGSAIAVDELELQPSTRRFTAPSFSTPIDATLGDQARLLGVDVGPWRDPAQPLTVTLVWQAIAPLPTSYSVFVHLLDRDGRLLSQSDAIPAGDYPTTRWLPGEVVIDIHTLPPPVPNAPGPYRLVAGLYDPVSDQRLQAFTADQQLIPDGAIPLGEVAPP